MASTLPEFTPFTFNGYPVNEFSPATILNARILNEEGARDNPQAIIELHAEARRDLIASGYTSQNLSHHLAVNAPNLLPLHSMPAKTSQFVLLDIIALARLIFVSIIRNSSQDINIIIGEFIKNNIPPSVLVSAGFFSVASRKNLINHILPALRTIQHDPPLQHNSHTATIAAIASQIIFFGNTRTENERHIDFSTIAENIDIPYFTLCPDWYFFCVLTPLVFEPPSGEITQEAYAALFAKYRTDVKAILRAIQHAQARAYSNPGIAVDSIPSMRREDVSDAVIYNTLAIANIILTTPYIDKNRDMYREIITIVSATVRMGFSRIRTIDPVFHRTSVDSVDISVQRTLFNHIANMNVNDILIDFYPHLKNTRSPFAIPVDLTHTTTNTIQTIYHHTFTASYNLVGTTNPSHALQPGGAILLDNDAARALLLFRDPGVYTSMVAMAAMGLIHFPYVANSHHRTPPVPMFDTLCPVMWSHILYLQQTLLPIARKQYKQAVCVLFALVLRALFHWTEVYLPLPGNTPLPIEVALFIQTIINIRRYAVADEILTQTLFAQLSETPNTATTIVRRYFLPVPDTLTVRVADMDEIDRIQHLQPLITSGGDSDDDTPPTMPQAQAKDAYSHRAEPFRPNRYFQPAASHDDLHASMRATERRTAPFPPIRHFQPHDDLHASMRTDEQRPHMNLVVHADSLLTPIFAPVIKQDASADDEPSLALTLLRANNDLAREYAKAQHINKSVDSPTFTPAQQARPLTLTESIIVKIRRERFWEPRETSPYPPNWMPIHCRSFRGTHLVRRNTPPFTEQLMNGDIYILQSVPPTSSLPQTATVGDHTYTYIDNLYPPHSDLVVCNYFYTFIRVFKHGTPDLIVNHRQQLIKLFPELRSVRNVDICDRLQATFEACIATHHT